MSYCQSTCYSKHRNKERIYWLVKSPRGERSINMKLGRGEEEGVLNLFSHDKWALNCMPIWYARFEGSQHVPCYLVDNRRSFSFLPARTERNYYSSNHVLTFSLTIWNGITIWLHSPIATTCIILFSSFPRSSSAQLRRYNMRVEEQFMKWRHFVVIKIICDLSDCVKWQFVSASLVTSYFIKFNISVSSSSQLLVAKKLSSEHDHPSVRRSIYLSWSRVYSCPSCSSPPNSTTARKQIPRLAIQNSDIIVHLRRFLCLSVSPEKIPTLDVSP